MKRFFLLCVLIGCCLIVPPAFSEETVMGEAEKFNTEQMLSEMEKKFKLSKEQLEKLKPALSAKSAELQKSMQESIDKGVIEFEKLSKKLDSLSKDAVSEMQEVMSGDQMQQLREYLGKVDKEALRQMKDALVEELSQLLKLTEEQAIKIKPILEESFTELAMMVERLSEQGVSSLEDFKVQYDELVQNLREKLQSFLDKEQMDSLDNHSEELKEKIQENVIAI
ncbi:MAG: hypothetical protein ACN4GW_13040 [Desulforhopalus sp.]